MRRPGGGRKRATELDPGLRPALLALVEPQERGDPVSPLRWTAKSTRALAAELAARGHRVCAVTVGELLRAEGFSLRPRQHSYPADAFANATFGGVRLAERCAAQSAALPYVL